MEVRWLNFDIMSPTNVFGALCSLFLCLLLFVSPTRALPIPSSPPVPLALILCLSVFPSSLVVLLISKLVYMKLRRINYIHSFVSTSKTPFPLLVGMLGSPDWEVKMKSTVRLLETLDQHTSTFRSDAETFPSPDEFGISHATRRVCACSRSPIPSLPALAHIPPCFENNSGFSLPMPHTTDSSPRSLGAPSEESAKIRLVSLTSKSSLDSASFLSATSKFSTPSRVVHQDIIATPSKLKTKYLYRKTPPMPFLPIQTPPDSPFSGNTASPKPNTVFYCPNRQESPPVIVQRISHPYAESQPAYSLCLSPRHPYEKQRSPTVKESPDNSRNLSSSPLLNRTRQNLNARPMNLSNSSPFFSSVSSNISPLCSDRTAIETTPPANIKLIPFSSTGIGKIVSDRAQCIPDYAYGATPSIPYEFSSFLESKSHLPTSTDSTLRSRQDFGTLTGDEQNGLLQVNQESSGRRNQRTPAILFSIPEEDAQSRSSKSFNRLSNANTATWRNSGNTTYGDMEITVTALPGPAVPYATRQNLSRDIELGEVDDDMLFVDEAEDGEESRACLMGLLEELEEWGCEWVDNKELPNGQGVGTAW